MASLAPSFGVQISIHSPIAEADPSFLIFLVNVTDFNPQPHRRGWQTTVRGKQYNVQFQSTAPSQRLTSCLCCGFLSAWFQSTAPSQRLTEKWCQDWSLWQISIHSPIAEADSKYTYTFHILLIFLLNYTISPYYTQVILLLIPISIKTLIKLPGANLSQFSCALGIRTKVILVQKAKLSINFYEHHRPYT